ncbi:fluoride efflux transporter CrcB [Rhodococcus sp. NPDC127528]|uniref:fluoride efflux transporter CrcB n=1 Tax=unclassified Rhodococcus (in: high G+C Gram-positive bacteria) TaxID=192944 RepID=UPI00363D19FF
MRGDWSLLAVVAAGGALGSLARYGVAQVIPVQAGQLPWATLITNVVGCFLIGVLMVVITEVWTAHRLLRPFLGVGILGGFTTFSTYAVEVRGLLADGHYPLAFGYLAGSVIAALTAALAGVSLTRVAAGARIGKGI